jgi:hypothetical protein
VEVTTEQQFERQVVQVEVTTVLSCKIRALRPMRKRSAVDSPGSLVGCSKAREIK